MINNTEPVHRRKGPQKTERTENVLSLLRDGPSGRRGITGREVFLLKAEMLPFFVRV